MNNRHDGLLKKIQQVGSCASFCAHHHLIENEIPN